MTTVDCVSNLSDWPNDCAMVFQSHGGWAIINYHKGRMDRDQSTKQVCAISSRITLSDGRKHSFLQDSVHILPS